MAQSATNHPFLIAKKRPLILGHRGLPHRHQENTAAGLRAAVAEGIDGVEFDVHLTRDERVVVIHDASVERLTEGAGLVRDLTWDQISKLRLKRDIPMGKDAQGRDIVFHYPQEQPFSLLDEILAEFKGKLAMNIEIKPTHPKWDERHVGTHVGRVIREQKAGDSVIVTSFDFLKLHAFEKEAPEFHSGITYDDEFADFLPRWIERLPELPTELARRTEGNQNPEVVVNALFEANAIGRWIGSTVVGAEFTLFDSNSIAKFHARGMAVGAYTLFPIEAGFTRRPVSEAQQAEFLREQAALGLDWVETDDPDKARAALD